MTNMDFKRSLKMLISAMPFEARGLKLKLTLFRKSI
jgi:hypothetical protein